MALNILAQIVPAVFLVVQSNPVDNLSGAVVLGDPILGWEVVELPGSFHDQHLHDGYGECFEREPVEG